MSDNAQESTDKAFIGPPRVGAGHPRHPGTLGTIDNTGAVTYFLLAIMLVVFLVAQPPDEQDVYWLLRHGANYGPLIAAGDYWRLLSSQFLHHGLLHLFVNGYSLFMIVPLVARRLGALGVFGIFLFSGAAGGLASFAFHPEVVSVGASGALFGLLGAILMLEWDSPKGSDGRRVWYLSLTTLLLNVCLGAFVPNLDYAAHFGGLLGGLLFCRVAGGLVWFETLFGSWLPIGVITLSMAGYCGWMIHLEATGVRQPLRDVLNRNIACSFQLPAHYMIQAFGEDCVLSPDGRSLIIVRSLTGNLPENMSASQRNGPSTDFSNLHASLIALLRAQGLNPIGGPEVSQRGKQGYLKFQQAWTSSREPSSLPHQSADAIYVFSNPERVILVMTRGRALNDRLEQGLASMLETLTILEPEHSFGRLRGAS
jgi:membrane associated rhomboid family serine protease